MTRSYAIAEMHSLAIGLGRILFSLKVIVALMGYALLVQLLDEWGGALYEKCYWLLCLTLFLVSLKNLNSRQTLRTIKEQLEAKKTALSPASLARQQKQHNIQSDKQQQLLPDDQCDTLLTTASELRSAGSYSEARKQLTPFVTKYSNESIAILLLKVLNDEASSHRKGDQQKQALALGLQQAETLCSKSPSCAEAWRWKAVFLGRLSSYKGTKEKIADAYKIRDSAKKALSLDSEDPISLHVLGAWCHGVAKITWIERQAAAAIFGTPPSSTLQEALEYLQQADAIEPFMENSSLLGECYQELGNKAMSNKFFELAIEQANREGQAKDVTSQIEKIKEKMKKNN
eukprot:TRINITY_DN8784_c0_g1_i1.p1 TRINITY_DN8784_c0_g1~~TRINITY_DN8784_c0_g1_i1.p1  ORF type:complete len:345 (+),score=66.72 TRINITY_DN8784_c0_g1_i1:54-1088(+)